ncbi:hypothetical protein WALSEDRAFT_60065 [Wallemia mellicola CBS 633.66]|uniref:Uncharacterized protein n=2 Tax=Wallemia mellicola TaxID=1708541 RepID=A0A4T0QT82_9BASI|nr:hypothetical protein WALSEDRAFT_60065 [Wallemia mellicola CBS 633.66]TIB67991.1 hypothetical protein E3Q24_03835 [Wallemia mellicola]EIM22424.1 hypothetical protein WALSEDRAFT_60065 [Wallemia mellicola CBS 633.66]TIB76355.1 hypothetical protein E3Q23_01909 [Wallemia mellicola]TIB80100.1 hypothetical protein E3Q21_03915 [Wallemia mellicola]TIB84022.1 hypothetical protein E3Q20_03868 [Wallemia mellicola]|eukprot:XP_006957669.1 hypothetical protein WALSEDRAFT_60065 [Wallemia mellicola CBS 633.66]
MVRIKFVPRPGDKRGDHLFLAAILLAVFIICIGYLTVFVIIYRRKYRLSGIDNDTDRESNKDTRLSIKTLSSQLSTNKQNSVEIEEMYY